MFVTYGKKNIVCNVFCSHLIELSATEIINAIIIEIGTEINIMNVFGIAYLTKFVSFAPLYVVNPKITPKLLRVNPSFSPVR